MTILINTSKGVVELTAEPQERLRWMIDEQNNLVIEKALVGAGWDSATLTFVHHRTFRNWEDFETS